MSTPPYAADAGELKACRTARLRPSAKRSEDHHLTVAQRGFLRALLPVRCGPRGLVLGDRRREYIHRTTAEEPDFDEQESCLRRFCALCLSCNPQTALSTYRCR
jgi:hypothetical protein